MKELEELTYKIDCILDQHLLAGGTGCIDWKGEASIDIAKEVKDIAIAFEWYAQSQRLNRDIGYDEDLFDQFIKERYKP